MSKDPKYKTESDTSGSASRSDCESDLSESLPSISEAVPLSWFDALPEAEPESQSEFGSQSLFSDTVTEKDTSSDTDSDSTQPPSDFELMPLMPSPIFGNTVKRRRLDQVPGYPSWYNIVYDGDVAVYTYQLLEDWKKGTLKINVFKE
ncbi:uncharacterized protein LOC134239822 [Saccostrea cucullata]|uniref:uncharacterized protein LOC134239822 n=1 Tax=Saccostrea cuccullata TaxID=36930 RepID=UPI002ED4B143